MEKRPLNIRVLLLTVLLVLGIVTGCLVYERSQGPLTAPAPLATWPWPRAVVTTPHPGVTCWTDRSSSNGDILRLIRFDFDANPGLRFAIYDQDSDDTIPRDDNVDFWPMGVAQATAHVNGTMRGGQVIAACNGLFFGSEYAQPKPGLPPPPPHGLAHHVTATVDNGVVRYNVGSHRWTFGVKYSQTPPLLGAGSQVPAVRRTISMVAHDFFSHGGAAPMMTFDVAHMPDRQTLASTFTYAAGGAQCLIHDGLPLRLRPFPGPIDTPDPLGAPSTPYEAGHIPLVDHIKTSRISFGWSQDSKQLYLLFVRQRGTETGSVLAFRMRGIGFPADSRARMLEQGGWDIADEQRFWRKLGVWGAINDDGGDPAQLTLIDPTGKYHVFPASWASPIEEIDNVDLSRTSPQTAALPQGGSLMYFYIYNATSTLNR